MPSTLTEQEVVHMVVENLERDNARLARRLQDLHVKPLTALTALSTHHMTMANDIAQMIGGPQYAIALMEARIKDLSKPHHA